MLINTRKIINELKYFSPLESTNIDYMHSFLLGVVEKLLIRWFSAEHKNKKYSLHAYIDQVDSKLLKIKPPRFIPYAPRSITKYKLWRCHEHLAFILYYALIVLNGIMRAEYYSNLILIVCSMEILLSKSKIP